ncbi:hypothetical protein [Nocardia blacklockiae]|uniref:hypothetical protein n=1 Tax=Nocardia blacklockiae TaxID=480036 RepID=UPI0018935FF7|nr:hypothetical protein [Nocardia blacklockiae]MBF6175787.1 hypothetical protein [Nocardia blacklockiae]
MGDPHMNRDTDPAADRETASTPTDNEKPAYDPNEDPDADPDNLKSNARTQQDPAEGADT